MRIVGIDPGITGAIGLISTCKSFSGTLETDLVLDADVFDLPVSRDKSLSWIHGLEFSDLLKRTAPTHAVVERVSTMRGQGIASGFHFGMTFGAILAILQSLHIPYTLVTPVQWKKALKLPGGKDKKASLEMARALFPTADLSKKKHHNRAEALLLAYWYLSSHGTLKVPPLPALPV